MCCMPVRHGGRYVRVVAELSFDAQPFHRKETRLVEGLDSLDTLSVFEAAVVDDRTRDWAERRVGGPELCMDNPDMDISWATPY